MPVTCYDRIAERYKPMRHMTMLVGYEKPCEQRNAARMVSVAMVTFVVDGRRKYVLVPQSQQSRTGVAHSCAQYIITGFM